MRKMKKLASMMLALVMVLAMSVTAFAEGEVTDPTENETGYTITISNSTSGYTYTVYQIFTGDLYEGVLSNIEFGSALDETDQETLLNKYNVTDVTALAEAIASANDAQALAEELTGSSYTLVSCGTLSYSAEDGNYSLSGLAAGYYLIVNTAVPSGDNTSYSNYIVQVVDDVTMAPKASDVPSSDKTVDDINDSTNAEVKSQETADYDIGDNVPFTLTATLPSNEYFADYETYKIVFHDTLSSGLTFNSNSVVVTVTTGDTTTTVSSGYTVVYPNNAEGADSCTFEVQIPDVHSLYDAEGNKITVSAGSIITVTYTAELNSNAGYSETNKMYLEYSNNPNSDGTGTTPEDITTVFTFTLTVNKVKEDEESETGTSALVGAAFTLYKYDPNNTEANDDGFVVVKEYTVDEENPVSSFEFKGLDDGQYMLVETETPDGYNSIDPIYFTITATHSEDENGNGKVDSLTVTQTNSSWTALTNGTQTFSATASTGAISTDVVNNAGSSLPSTGGIGTTIFYIVGTILVLGAAVLLITRRRMSKAE